MKHRLKHKRVMRNRYSYNLLIKAVSNELMDRLTTRMDEILEYL
jgi:hypothetical protein